MITNNFYKAILTIMGGGYATDLKTLINTAGQFSQTSNNAYQAFSGFSNGAKTVVTAAAVSASPGMAFGTGTVPPTPEDYWLSGNVITTLNIVACVVTSGVSDGFLRMSNEVTVKNTSDTETVVINEMGVVGKFNYGSSYSYACLTDRTVLDTPLTLAPGEQGVITYTLNWPIVQ